MQAPATPHSYEKRVEQLERDKRLLQQQLEEAQFKNKRLQERLKRLEKELDESHRAAHRQAAPFSKGEPKAEPKTPGRKAGSDYGEPSFRPVPPRVNEVLPVPVWRRCVCQLGVAHLCYRHL